MQMTREVETSLGTFTLKKPKAGIRNKAMIKAETDTGFKNTVLVFDLLPKCILKRPDSCDSDVPIDQLLDSMETEDYDALASVLTDMINPRKVDIDNTKMDFEEEEKKKQSGTTLTVEDSQTETNTESG